MPEISDNHFKRLEDELNAGPIYSSAAVFLASSFSTLLMDFVHNIILLSLIILLLNMITKTKGETWHHVFTATTGGMERVYDLYIGNDTSVLTKQEAASSSSRIKQHFKSDIINYWEYFNIEQVKISVNTDGTEEAYFIFNGTETNKTNWFSTDRILRSSYTGLTSNTTKLYFSNLGHELDYSHHMLFLIAEYDRDDILQPKMLVLDAKRQKNVIVFFPLNFTDSRKKKVDNLEMYIKFGPCTIEYDEENVSRTTITTESTNITKVYTSAKEEINNTQHRIEKLKKVLHVDPKSTSNYKRSLNSVYESRISAVSIGTVAISVILSIFVTVIAIDVVTNSKHIKKFVIRKYRLCRSFKFK